MKNFSFLLTFLLLPTFFMSQIPSGPGGVGTSSELEVWLDATKISSANGDPIATWSDISGNGNDFSQSSAPLIPTFNSSGPINSGPSVEFVNDHLVTSSSISNLNSTDLSWITVLNTSNADLQVALRSSYTTGANIGSTTLWGLYNTSSQFISHTRESTKPMVTNSTSFNTTTNIFTSVWNGSADFSTYLNESLVGSQSGASANPSGHNNITLGANSANPSLNQYSFIGDISEVIVYNTNINDAQRIILDNYLSTKYSIALSSNDKYSTNNDTFYGNELAGIGREDASNEHLDAQGEGIVRITAASLDNNDYLLFGHDGIALNSTTTGTPSAYTTATPAGEIYERTWRVTETNEVGDLTISFDVSSNGFGLTPDYELLIDTDGDFSSGANVISGVYSSGIVTFSVLGSELEDDYYFTLGNPSTNIISIIDGQTWNDNTTWNCSCIPSSSSTVTIDAGHTVSVSASSNALDLNVVSTAGLDLSGGTLNVARNLDFQTGSVNNLNGVLDVEGNLTNSGTTNSSGSFIFVGGNWDNSLGSYTYFPGDSLTFDGSSLSTISGATDWNILTIDNSSGVSVSSGIHNIFGVLNIVSGTFNTGSAVTLKSNASGTAQMDDLESGDISGNLTVERFISMSNQGLREITSPVQSTHIIDWQNNGVIFSGFTNSTYPTFPYLNAFTYVEPNALGVKNNGWFNAQDANTDDTGPLSGHRVYMDAVDYTLSVTGSPYKNTQVIPVSQTGGAGSGDDQNGWNLIGNPYPCTIDWDLVTKSGIEDAVWTWNATDGQYGLHWSGGSSNGVTNEIAHSQAFWVKAISSSGSVTINEDDKVRTDKAFVKTYNPSNDMHVFLTGNINSYKDELIVRRLPNASESYDQGLEFPKLFTEIPDESPSLSVLCEDSINLCVAAVNDLISSELKLSAIAGINTQGTYTLNFNIPDGFMEYGCIQLEDLHNGVITDLRIDSSYTFVSSDTTTLPRFLLKMFRDYNVTSTDASCYNIDDASMLIEGEFINSNTYELFSNGTLISSSIANGNSVLFDNLFAGNYQIFSNQNFNCNNNISNIELNQPIEVLAEFTSNEDTLMIGQFPAQLQLTNNSIGAMNYTWDFDDGNFSNETHPVHFYSSAGSYDITLLAENSLLPMCFSEQTKNIVVIDSTSLIVPTNSEISNISVYSFNDKIVIDFNVGKKMNLSFDIFNSLGQLVYRKELSISGNNSIEIPGILSKNQIYFLVIKNGFESKSFKLF